MQLVRCKKNGLLYAMKTVKKKMLDNEQKQKSVLIEKDILERVDNNFVVKMHYYFENKKQHSFIVDFCPGGELFTHIHAHGKIKLPLC